MRRDCTGVDWQLVMDTLRQVGMGYHRPERHRTAFENSYAVVFAYDGVRMIGFGRAVSDGAYQAALYDIAVTTEYQQKGIGAAIVGDILERLPAACNIILYAMPGREGFYGKRGFRRMKTAMARFVRAELMQEKGFTD